MEALHNISAICHQLMHMGYVDRRESLYRDLAIAEEEARELYEALAEQYGGFEDGIDDPPHGHYIFDAQFSAMRRRSKGATWQDTAHKDLQDSLREVDQNKHYIQVDTRGLIRSIELIIDYFETLEDNEDY